MLLLERGRAFARFQLSCLRCSVCLPRISQGPSPKVVPWLAFCILLEDRHQQMLERDHKAVPLGRGGRVALSSIPLEAKEQWRLARERKAVPPVGLGPAAS